MLFKSTILLVVAPLVAAALSTQANATSLTKLEQAQAFYASGDFAKATATAQSVHHPEARAEALSLACKSQLVLGGFNAAGPESIAALHSAIAYCASALRLDPTHFEARFNLAVALGFEGRRVRVAKYAIRSRAEIETLITENPENPVALGALAGWHSEAAKEGFLARTFLGASRKKAQKLFEKAVIGTRDIALNYEYLRFLAAGKKTDREEALRFGLSFLEQQNGNVPQTAFEAMLLNRAETLVTALRSYEKQQVLNALDTVAAFPGIKDYKTSSPRYPLPPEITLGEK